MAFAVSVVKFIEHETMNPASSSSKVVSDQDFVFVQDKVSAFIDQGPISLSENVWKRKAEDVIDIA